MLKKTAIRQAIVNLLKDNITILENRVYGGRVLPYSKEELYPFISVYNKTDDVEEYYTDYTLRNNDINIVVVNKYNSSNDLLNYDFDKSIEDIQLLVESAFDRILSISNLQNDPFKLVDEIIYVSSTTSDNVESGNNIGQAILTYNVKYKVEHSLKVSSLVDLDTEATKQNLDIIQLRPLQG